jgi:hypothetical protein
MSVNITIQAGEDSHFAPDITRLPAQIEVARPAANPFPLIVVAFGLFISYQLFAALLGGLALPVMLLGGAALVLAALLWWRQSGLPHLLSFDKEGVTVTERRLIAAKRWRAGYSEFEGLMLRTIQARSPSGKTTYEIIELKHRDPDKTLPLYAARSSSEPRARWKALAELLGVPALQSSQDEA